MQVELTIGVICVKCGMPRNELQIIALCNGDFIHEQCYKDLIDQRAAITKYVVLNENKIYEIEARIRREKLRRKSLMALLSIFTRASASTAINSAKDEINKYENLIISYQAKYSVLQKIIVAIWDYWPTYPPDWERRRAIARKNGCCSRCGSSIFLQTHHLTPIAKGGNHKTTNLVCLCERCHQASHGVAKFHYNERANVGSDLYAMQPVVGADPYTETSVVASGSRSRQASGGSRASVKQGEAGDGLYTRRLEKIKKAIGEGRIISFNYMKRSGQRMNRVVLPKSVKLYKRDYDGVLCMEGYCYMRKAERTFAVNRMRNVQFKSAP